MAIFHQLVSDIRRGTFTCAVGTAAYRSGSNLSLNGYNFDYSTKPGVAFSSIMAPSGVPKWVFDRQLLWEAIEDIEKRFDAHLAREYTVALPEELTTEQNIDLIKELVDTCFVSRKMVADVNYHNDHLNNVHVHIMCPTRSLNDSKKRPEWHTKTVAESIAEMQESVINKHLKKHGVAVQISRVPVKTNLYDSMRPWL